MCVCVCVCVCEREREREREREWFRAETASDLLRVPLPDHCFPVLGLLRVGEIPASFFTSLNLP